MNQSVAWYDANAESVARRYESVDPDSIYSWLTEMLPEPPAIVLDVGSGTGRDAAWLAGKGFEVYAAEPSSAMRGKAKNLHPTASVHWTKDSLPALSRTTRTGLSFDVILLSAVWMHVKTRDRTRAFRKLINLLKPGGLMAMSIRQGPADPDRGFHPVDDHEIETLAKGHGAIAHRVSEDADQLGRTDVRWANYVVRLPDDGTGALPLLRHVILNDNKSSTYKLGLLRTLCRIADGQAGMANPRPGEDFVSVPLGLVALTWIRLYKPLLRAGCPQSPANVGDARLGFVRQPFRELAEVSDLDLRPGMRLSARNGNSLYGAIRDAASLIERMPAHYLTFADGRPILPVRRLSPRVSSDSLLIDEPFLRSYGEMLVPSTIWRALQRYAVWIEPALVEEWLRLMAGYAQSQGRSLERDRAVAAMAWSDPGRNVRPARNEAERVLSSGNLHCVWSGRSLSSGDLDIDHCLPWSAWPCSDLWNLMPANRSVNSHQKRERLPTVGLMRTCQDRIMGWWEAAYRGAAPAIQERFVHEATATLPALHGGKADLDSLFEAMLAQRSRLRVDQRVPEWPG